MSVSLQQLFTARQRTAVEDMTCLQLKLGEMRNLCPERGEDMETVLKALVQVQQKLANIKKDDKQ